MMAVYEVEGPDGKTYEVEGPEGATDEQIISAVRRQLRIEAREAREKAIEDAFAVPYPERPEGSLFTDILKSPLSGAINTLEMAGAGCNYSAW
jgi:cell division protein YceG involved in septum cleavage